jgi:hypothetical protein
VNYDNGFFMAFAGGGSPEVFCFGDVSAGTWTRGADFPVNIGPGGADVAQAAVVDQNGQNVPGAGEVFGFGSQGQKSFFETSTVQTQSCPQFVAGIGVPEFGVPYMAVAIGFFLVILVIRFGNRERFLPALLKQSEP